MDHSAKEIYFFFSYQFSQFQVSQLAKAISIAIFNHVEFFYVSSAASAAGVSSLASAAPPTGIGTSSNSIRDMLLSSFKRKKRKKKENKSLIRMLYSHHVYITNIL